MEDTELIHFIREKSQQAKYTASVCTGALLLAKAGILKGRPATTHWLAMGELARLGGLPRRERMVKDGKIITGAGVSAGIDMALTLVADLYGSETVGRALTNDPHLSEMLGSALYDAHLSSSLL
jgi:cyclohexyl-isocyanide hydratase